MRRKSGRIVYTEAEVECVDAVTEITPLFSVVVTPSLARREGARGCVRPEDHASGL
jgi:hypothetical protein